MQARLAACDNEVDRRPLQAAIWNAHKAWHAKRAEQTIRAKLKKGKAAVKQVALKDIVGVKGPCGGLRVSTDGSDLVVENFSATW